MQSGAQKMQKKFNLHGKRIWVAGHNGFVGSALHKGLQNFDSTLLTADKANLDLRKSTDVDQWVGDNKIDVIFVAAAKVGGIEANRTFPVEFMVENLQISTNIIQSAYQHNVCKLVNLGSSCFYPRLAEQPIKESSLLTAPLEPTNEAYALAKITAAKLCEFYKKQYNKNFVTLVPSNLYGPGDHFEPLHSHVISAMIMKIHHAVNHQEENVEFWGTGSPIREFLFIDDAIEGILFACEHQEESAPMNISGGEVISIYELAHLIAKISKYEGELRFDTSKPDGMPKKVLCNEKIKALGWEPKTTLIEGLSQTIRHYQTLQGLSD